MLGQWHTHYLALTVIAIIGGSAGISYRLSLLRQVGHERFRSARSLSAKVLDTQSSGRVNALAISSRNRKVRLKEIRRDIISAVVSLGVFFVEDLPMAILNITVLMNTGLTAEGSMVVPEPVMLVSLALSMTVCPSTPHIKAQKSTASWKYTDDHTRTFCCAGRGVQALEIQEAQRSLQGESCASLCLLMTTVGTQQNISPPNKSTHALICFFRGLSPFRCPLTPWRCARRSQARGGDPQLG